MEPTEPTLFPSPPRRLPRQTQAAVFGGLPTRLARELDEPAVAALVSALLNRGWLAGQLAARVGALPAAADPCAAVQALLRSLASDQTPQELAAAERDRRALAAPDRPRPASADVKARYVRQIRRDLGLVPRPLPPPPPPRRPPCALCGAESGFFVTHRVRLCPACVHVLESGQARLVAAG